MRLLRMMDGRSHEQTLCLKKRKNKKEKRKPLLMWKLDVVARRLHAEDGLSLFYIGMPTTSSGKTSAGCVRSSAAHFSAIRSVAMGVGATNVICRLSNI